MELHTLKVIDKKTGEPVGTEDYTQEIRDYFKQYCDCKKCLIGVPHFIFTCACTILTQHDKIRLRDILEYLDYTELRGLLNAVYEDRSKFRKQMRNLKRATKRFLWEKYTVTSVPAIEENLGFSLLSFEIVDDSLESDSVEKRTRPSKN